MQRTAALGNVLWPYGRTAVRSLSLLAAALGNVLLSSLLYDGRTVRLNPAVINGNALPRNLCQQTCLGMRVVSLLQTINAPSLQFLLAAPLALSHKSTHLE